MTDRTTHRDPVPPADLSLVQTYRLAERASLVGPHDFVDATAPPPTPASPEIVAVADAMCAAADAGAAVVWQLGGHVVKCGLAPVVIDLMERGAITHLASNGAATIHDVEIALQGQTSEDVGSSIEDGSFGMAEETGALMNAAIRAGAADGIGMGAALGRMLDGEEFACRNRSILHAAHRLGIPYTVHVAIGTDIIHQHPACDFAATGRTSGIDFRRLVTSVSRLEGGVFCNIGSAVIGPEVFLKALSVARNLGSRVERFTTANFDLRHLDAPDVPSSADEDEYYYRPKKNVLLRPTSLGGRGIHVRGDHRATIPALAAEVRGGLAARPSAVVFDGAPATVEERLAADHPRAAAVLSARVSTVPELRDCRDDLARGFRLLAAAYLGGGTVFVCGNGGSHADAVHIAGELDKSMEASRPIPARHRERLHALGAGDLAAALEAGLRTVALGTNSALTSAISNDLPLPGAELAQELYALARPGDALLALSTSGTSVNVVHAARIAKVLGAPTVAFTGCGGGDLADLADVTVKAPASDTPTVQHWHRPLYHALCAMLEHEFFGGDREGS